LHYQAAGRRAPPQSIRQTAMLFGFFVFGVLAIVFAVFV